MHTDENASRQINRIDENCAFSSRLISGQNRNKKGSGLLRCLSIRKLRKIIRLQLLQLEQLLRQQRLLLQQQPLQLHLLQPA